MTEQEQPKMTEKELHDRLVTIFGEIDLLNTDIKELKAEAKEADIPNPRIAEIAAVAKAKAECKLGEKVIKAESFVETANEFGG